MMRLCVAVLIAALTTSAWRAPALAQPSPTSPADRRERVKERVLALRAAVLTRELRLDEATAARLFPILARHDAEMTRLAREAAALRRTADEAAGRGDDAAVNRAIDTLIANQRARWAVEEARFREVRAVLTPAQAARILVVLPAIDRRIHRQMRRALDGGPRGRRIGPPRGPAGPPP